MALADRQAGGKVSVQQQLRNTNPLNQLTEQYREIAGRSLDAEQLGALMFLLYNGSPSLAADVLHCKQFQADQQDFKEMTRQVSVNEVAREQMEAEAQARARSS